MKDLKMIVNYVWKHLKGYKRIVVAYMFICLLYDMMEMIDTFILGYAIDNMLLVGTTKGIIACAVTFMCVNVLSFIVTYFAKVNGQNILEIVVDECRIQMIRRIDNTSLLFIENMGTSKLMQRLHKDIMCIVIFVLNTGAMIVSNTVIFLSAFVMIFHYDILCGAIALAELPVIAILYKMFQKRLLSYSNDSEKKIERRYHGLLEVLRNIGGYKKNQITDLLEERLKKHSTKAIAAIKKEEQIGYYYNIINNNMDVFLKVFLFFYGGVSVINGKMTVGEFTIIYSYFAMITSSCSYFLNLGKTIQKNKTYYTRLKEITDVPEETNGMVLLPYINEVELSHIKFGYNEAGNVLTDFSCTFRKGNLYAVAGGNGCGKSTMTSLLLGMYIDECQGEITYNGHSIKELDMRTLRKERIGVCEQEPYLIEDTIRYNMIYSNDTVADETLMKLAYHVSFDEFLKNSENGLDTLVGEGGNTLSGGQKQKTALVKVFYKNPDVMVLDEPTSAMDAEGQERFIKYLEEIKKDKIVIVITHDERMIEAADEVVRM